MANPKGDLLERTVREGLGKADFKTKMTGPEHEPNFHTEVTVQGQHIGTGEGTTKKSAEKRAAEAAILYLDDTDNLRNLPAGNLPNDDASDEPFDGPYPMFQRFLAEALRVANTRVDSKLKGEAALGQIRDLTLKLYKETLLGLGEVVDGDD
ncbi:MAG: putative dsRNA-binding protein [Trueperaceae bacterium]